MIEMKDEDENQCDILIKLDWKEDGQISHAWGS